MLGLQALGLAEMFLLFLCVKILRPNLFCFLCLATLGDGGKELVGLCCTGSMQQCVPGSVCLFVLLSLAVLFLAVAVLRFLVLCTAQNTFPGLFLRLFVLTAGSSAGSCKFFGGLGTISFSPLLWGCKILFMGAVRGQVCSLSLQR